MTLNEYAEMCHKASVDAGWYTDIETGRRITRNVPEMIALIHSEVSEMLEGCRKSKADDHLPDRMSVEVEAADVLVRMFDLAGYLDLDLDGALAEKMEYNRTRSDHKLENRRNGGKAF